MTANWIGVTGYVLMIFGFLLLFVSVTNRLNLLERNLIQAVELQDRALAITEKLVGKTK